MKKFTVAILALLYFTISTGMVVNIHYCMGKVSSVKVNLLPDDFCACGKKQTKGCCKTEAKLVKLEDTHKATVIASMLEVPVQEAIVIEHFYIEPALVDASTIQVSNHSPPILSKQDTYLQNCVFRI